MQQNFHLPKVRPATGPDTQIVHGDARVLPRLAILHIRYLAEISTGTTGLACFSLLTLP
jgi:hypothetical protein